MIEFIKIWASQIIVAVIISIIFEMILPNGNNKKYVKMVIGLYILFTIIQPIITKITGNSISISSKSYEKYFNKEILEDKSDNFENNNSKLIKQAYINNIKEDIKDKLEIKGYGVLNCDVHIKENDHEYGEIESISLEINKSTKQKEKQTNSIKIDNVNVGNINSNSSNTKEINLPDNEKTIIIEYLSEEYSIEKNKIIIN